MYKMERLFSQPFDFSQQPGFSISSHQDETTGLITLRTLCCPNSFQFQILLLAVVEIYCRCYSKWDEFSALRKTKSLRLPFKTHPIGFPFSIPRIPIVASIQFCDLIYLILLPSHINSNTCSFCKNGSIINICKNWYYFIATMCDFAKKKRFYNTSVLEIIMFLSRFLRKMEKVKIKIAKEIVCEILFCKKCELVDNKW